MLKVLTILSFLLATSGFAQTVIGVYPWIPYVQPVTNGDCLIISNNQWAEGPCVGAGAAIKSLNGLTASSQTMITGTAGTDFNISDSVSVHTFNIPTASSSARGLLSPSDWISFNSKQTSGNYITALTGDLSASGPGSAVATLATVNGNVGTFGTSAMSVAVTVNAKGLTTAIGSTPIQIAESQVTNLLSDLASKQPSGNYITALTGDVSASGPGSSVSTLSTVNSNVGTFGTASSSVAITVNAKGLVTAVGSTPIQIAESQVTNLLSDLASKQGSITIGAIGSQTPNATALALSNNVLSIQSADPSNPGVINNTTQTLGSGTKTITGNTLIANNTSSVATIGGTLSTAIHTINGGLNGTTRTASANLILDTTTTDRFVFLSANRAITVTLPAITCGRDLWLKDISGTISTNNVLLTQTASAKIEGISTGRTLRTNYGAWHVVSDCTNWWLVN